MCIRDSFMDNLGKIIVDGLTGALAIAGVVIIAVARELIKRFIKAIKNMSGEVKNAFVTVVDKGIEYLKSLPGEALQWGKDFIQGFVDGIMSKAEALLESVRKIAKKIRALLGHSTPTEGPMAHDDEWMPDFMESLAKGIEANKFKVTQAIQGLSADMTMGVKYNALPSMAGMSAVASTTSGYTQTGNSHGPSITINNHGTIVGSNGMREFAKIVSMEIAGDFGLSTGGAG